MKVFVYSKTYIDCTLMPVLITNMQPEANRNFWHHQAIVKIKSNDKILGSMMQIVRVIRRDKELGELEKFDGWDKNVDIVNSKMILGRAVSFK